MTAADILLAEELIGTALEPVRARAEAHDVADLTTLSEFATLNVFEALARVWVGWEVVAAGVYPADVDRSSSGRPDYYAYEVIHQVVILRCGPVWTALDVILGEPPLFPDYAADTWDSLNAISRAYRVGSGALDRACPVGLGPIELAQSVGDLVAGADIMVSEDWWAQSRVADVLLRLDGSGLTGEEAAQVTAMHALAALGGFRELLGMVEKAGHRDNKEPLPCRTA